jgi:hypothetical protein
VEFELRCYFGGFVTKIKLVLVINKLNSTFLQLKLLGLCQIKILSSYKQLNLTFLQLKLHKFSQNIQNLVTLHPQIIQFNIPLTTLQTTNLKKQTRNQNHSKFA